RDNHKFFAPLFRILLLFTIVFISQPGLGQQTITMGGGLQGEYGFMGSDSHIKGSKYFFKEWGLGKIFFTDGKSSDNGLLQVDLELDQLLVNSGSDKTKGTLVDIDKVQKFTITEFQSDKPVSTATTF